MKTINVNGLSVLVKDGVVINDGIDRFYRMFKIINNYLVKVYVTQFIGPGVHSTGTAIDLGCKDDLKSLYEIWNILPRYGFSCFIADKGAGTGLHLHVQDDGRGRKGVEINKDGQSVFTYDYNNNHIASLYGASGISGSNNSFYAGITNKEVFIYIIVAILIILGLSK